MLHRGHTGARQYVIQSYCTEDTNAPEWVMSNHAKELHMGYVRAGTASCKTPTSASNVSTPVFNCTGTGKLKNLACTLFNT